MSEELKSSTVVTVLSVIGCIFGAIGVLGAFIPCFGIFALFIGIPAALVSGIGLGIAYQQQAKRTFAIVALTISLIGVTISGLQFIGLTSLGHQLQQEQQQRLKK